MDAIIDILLIVTAGLWLSQNTRKVNQLNQKVEELEERLNNNGIYD